MSEKQAQPKPVWRFRVEADRLPSGRYRLMVTTDSGTVIVRECFHPLWELIRIINKKERNNDI
ncbi:MAG: hypothetical protein IT440_11060 [Phycisphaeraceae bacterium]|nr:hypothetical protein [Phycisphaeraceae bacterium]